LNTPLHYAISHKNDKLTNLLRGKGADEEIPNKKGFTPWQCINNNLPNT